jgi:hypothetical protein
MQGFSTSLEANGGIKIAWTLDLPDQIEQGLLVDPRES